MGNTAVTNIRNLVVCVHNSKAPSADEWRRYLEVTAAAAATVGGDFTRIRTLVFTDGGGPNAIQRAEVSKMIGEKPSPGAIISGSTVVRGIVTALSWFNPAIRAFHPRDIDAGLRHIQLSIDDIAKVWPVLKTLQTQVEGVVVLSHVAQLLPQTAVRATG